MTARAGLTRFYCLLWLWLFSTAVQAQYRFDHWTADNGLPQNSVRDIVQTRDGYLWFTTFDGLVRFDGVRFTVFNKSNAPGILSNRFNWLYEDGFGDLWASTEDSGITRLHQGRFSTYTTANGLPGNTVGVIGGDGQGNLIVIYVQMILRWVDQKFVPTTVTPASALNGMSSAHLDDAKRLPCFSKVHNEVTFFLNGQERTWLLPQNGKDHFNSVTPMRDRQGDIWFYSRDKGLIRIDAQNRIKIFDQQDGLLGNKSVLVYGQFPLKAFSLGNNNSLWLTELESRASQLVAPQMPEGFDNLADIIVAFADREGNYWIGTAHNGLYRVRRQSVLTYAKAQGLTGTEVYPIYEAADGAIWIGTAANGLFQFKDQTFKNIATGTEQFGNTVSSLYQDRAGNLWMGGIDKVSRLVAGRVETVSPKITPPVLRTYWTIYEDTGGAFWFGAMEGVLRYENGVTTHFTTKDGLAGNDTKVVIPDGAGGLWFGSYGGLTHYKDGQFKAWTAQDGLPSNTVRALYQDRDGVLWIGTYDGGLGRFKDGKFTSYLPREGLFDSGVFQILEDDYGWFWMSCNRGIYRVRKQELNDFAAGKIKTISSIAYGKSDGLLNVECNGGRWPAGIKARDGKLWFPTMEGVAVIDPATVNQNPQPPPVLIEAFNVDRKPLAFEREVQLKPGQENFEVEYTALSFINSEHLQFRYQLVGLDQDWVNAGTRRTAYYPHVPPGNYTFKVIAANSDGLWNQTGQQLLIKVLPPFYRTWWFITLIGLGVAAGIAGLVRFRLNQLDNARVAQERFSRQLLASQEQERQRIAAELHDSLGQSLLIIKNRAYLALTGIEDAENTVEQLEEITNSATHAIEEARTIAYNLRPFQIDRFGLTKTLQAICQQAEQSSGIAFVTELDPLDGLFAKEAEINLYRIVQESINNIIKHSRATAARLTIRQQGQQLQLVIHDNGQGFEIVEGGTRKVEVGNQQVNGAPNPQAGGFGLIGMAERARMLGGTYTLQSAAGAGTTIKITLTLTGEKHES
ncbi:MAG: hypothetical protein HYR56_08825 [Acidobacteria bacterium]|nr:hypothetical protein [Acidobacteriota bacterium]MBI3422721.1 hypothetical protein [Acidobacteriota bacterium]